MKNSWWKNWRAESFAPLIAYALATWLTNARIMGDTLYYVDSILRVRAGGQKFSFWEPLGNYSFYEFGHLLWRPFGYLVVALYDLLAGSGETAAAAAADGRVRVTLVLVAVNWVAGLACVLSLHSLLRRLGVDGWVRMAVTISFICAHAFLNFTQTGSSYVPALAALLLGMYVLARAGARAEGRVWPQALLAGFALACAVGFWFLFVWAIPAALLLPVLFFGRDRRRLLLATATAFVCGAFVLSMYSWAAMWGLGITDVATFKAWVASSSHGLGNNRGVPQVVLGFARSFIEMGNDNIIFKRFLLRDPYNVVSMFDLLRLSLWKLALFYLALVAVVCALLTKRAENRRMLALLAVGSVPVITFALLWQGTPLERYLPLYPVFFLATAYALRTSEGFARWLRPVVLVFMAAAIVSNLSALLVGRVNRVPEEATGRTRELVPLLKPQSVVVEVSEELKDLQWAYPLHPLNRVLRVYSAVSLGASSTAEWREDFARQALLVWGEGGDVWLSKRVLEERPRAASSWVEGADPRVKWADVYTFFAQLEEGGRIGDRDGFVLVARTARNEQLLAALAQTKEPPATLNPAQSD